MRNHCRADDAAALTDFRACLDLVLAGVARTPTPPTRKDRAALAEARQVLDTNETRPILALFAAAGPDLPRALCEGTHIDASGQLVIGKVLTNATRVGVRGDAALLVADFAGLLDGVEVLSLRGIALHDLGVLRRHAKTLRFLDLYECGVVAQDQVLHGDALLRVLDAASPLEGDPTEALIAPIEVDRLPPLLGASTEVEVMHGVAIATGRVAEALAGCALLENGRKVRPGTLLGASRAGAEVQLRAVLALLEARPAGDATARAVTAELTSLDVAPAQVPAWTRHAAAVRTVEATLVDLAGSEGRPARSGA